MSQGHIRSILPQRGGVAPVDNDTLALFHYKHHAKDNLRGIRPIGNLYAFNFNGSTLIETSLPYFTGAQEVTFAAWVRLTAATGTYIIMGFAESGSWGVQRIEIASGKARAVFGAGTSSTSEVIGTSTISNGQWHLIVATHTPLENKIYVDGVLEGTTAAGALAGATGSFSIGGMGASGTTPFNGDISECSCWSKALTEEEIKKLTRFEMDSPGLVGYWKLDEGEGNIAYDSSANGNDGVTSNTVNWVQGQACYFVSEEGVTVVEGTTNLVKSPRWWTENNDEPFISPASSFVIPGFYFCLCSSYPVYAEFINDCIRVSERSVPTLTYP